MTTKKKVRLVYVRERKYGWCAEWLNERGESVETVISFASSREEAVRLAVAQGFAVAEEKA